MAKLILNRNMSLIQHKGVTYNVPNKPEIRNELGFKADVFKKRFELSQSMGLDMYEDGSFGCGDCRHTGVFEHARKHGGFSGKSEDFCKYIGNHGPHWLSYFSNGKEGFGARINPCVADTALLIALIDLGYFENYKVDTRLDLQLFPYEREVIKSHESVLKAIEFYSRHF